MDVFSLKMRSFYSPVLNPFHIFLSFFATVYYVEVFCPWLTIPIIIWSRTTFHSNRFIKIRPGAKYIKEKKNFSFHVAKSNLFNHLSRQLAHFSPSPLSARYFIYHTQISWNSSIRQYLHIEVSKSFPLFRFWRSILAFLRKVFYHIFRLFFVYISPLLLSVPFLLLLISFNSIFSLISVFLKSSSKKHNFVLQSDLFDQFSTNLPLRSQDSLNAFFIKQLKLDSLDTILLRKVDHVDQPSYSKFDFLYYNLSNFQPSYLSAIKAF